MNDQEQLLSKRWILKDEDRDTYYHIKDNMKSLKTVYGSFRLRTDQPSKFY